MKQIIAILLPAIKEVEEVRAKYVSSSEHVKPHITLVYPFIMQNQNELDKHIEQSLQKMNAFKVTLSGVGRSATENYLYLTVQEGEKEIKQLHDMLLQGILEGFENPNLPKYIPHLTLGKFDTQQELEKARKESEKLDLKITAKIDTIELLTLNEDNRVVNTTKYSL